MYQEKGINSFLKYFSSEKEECNYNSQLLAEVIDVVWKLWETKGFYNQ